jgi:phosphatidate cytidylyltransferase
LGVLVLWAAWIAITGAKSLGLNFLLSVFCLAWAADISAYFGGRAWGRHKLAPTISPGKSWEGVWSGMVGTLALAAGWIAADAAWQASSPSLYTLLYRQWGALAIVLGVPALTAMTVVGDLFKSVIKRVAGVKDSSNLLPGHGGVLDRIDALLPLFPLAWAFVLWSRG